MRRKRCQMAAVTQKAYELSRGDVNAQLSTPNIGSTVDVDGEVDYADLSSLSAL